MYITGIWTAFRPQECRSVKKITIGRCLETRVDSDMAMSVLAREARVPYVVKLPRNLIIRVTS